MKKLNVLFKRFTLSLVTLISFSSCEFNNNELTQNQDQSNNFIPEETAIIFANNLLFKDVDGNYIKKEVLNLKGISNATDNSNALYVINYKTGGFVILAADNRSFPIFAVSSTSKFELNDKNYPSGLVDWLETAAEFINKLKEDNKTQDNHTKYLWEHPNATPNKLLTTGQTDSKPDLTRRAPIDDPNYCNGSGEIISSMVKTTWSQGYGYNSNTPNLECSGTGHALTGCVATAMAQIMKYHNYHSNYNWALMPNNYGTDETSKLMSDIGNMVGMDYGCNNSGADTQGSVASAFKKFGYQSSASYVDYEGTANYNLVKSELRSGKPVILRGGRKRSGITWPWNYYTDGHAWVCDGFVAWSDCSVSMLSLYMNWGWTNGLYNGVYSFSNFNPGTETFNYKSGAVIGIQKPK